MSKEVIIKRVEVKEKKLSEGFFKLIIFLCVLVCAVLAYFYLAFLKDGWTKFSNSSQNFSTTTIQFPYQNKLNGQGVLTSAQADPFVIVAMIDNQVVARPQTGLPKADVIYEVMAEGNITRFIAVFNASSSVDKVGPIRSARPYFLDFASEYGRAVYLHVGGSPEALNELKNMERLFDVNEFYNGNYFWRDENRNAPHNVYTSSNNWNKLIANKEFIQDNSWQGLNFGTNDFVTNTEKTAGITVPYSSNYIVSWKYNEAIGRFDYYQNDKIYEDTNGDNLSADNLIVQFVSADIIDDYGRLEMTTVGSGEAMVFIKGNLIRGTWKKENKNARTKFYAQNGEEIKLISGLTFFQIVPPTVKVSLIN